MQRHALKIVQNNALFLFIVAIFLSLISMSEHLILNLIIFIRTYSNKAMFIIF